MGFRRAEGGVALYPCRACFRDVNIGKGRAFATGESVCHSLWGRIPMAVSAAATVCV